MVSATYKPIDWTKPLYTRAGSRVRIYAADCGGSKPVHGAFLESKDDIWYPCAWSITGRYVNDSKRSSLDLVNEETLLFLPTKEKA